VWIGLATGTAVTSALVIARLALRVRRGASQKGL
jgi:hypothetical protein